MSRHSEWRRLSAHAAIAQRQGDQATADSFRRLSNALRFQGKIEEMLAEKPVLTLEQRMRLGSLFLANIPANDEMEVKGNGNGSLSKSAKVQA